MLGGNQNVSSKRVAGLAGWFVVLGLVFGLVVFSVKTNEANLDLLKTTMYVSAMLIGGGVVENIVGKIGGKQKPH